MESERKEDSRDVHQGSIHQRPPKHPLWPVKQVAMVLHLGSFCSCQDGEHILNRVKSTPEVG